MQRGYSRDHRPDCKQVVIALIVNVEGFPLSYETFDGNRADVTTLESMLRMVERKYGKARRVWVFDRGIVSEENLEALRRRGGQYLVGTPRKKLKEFERELLEGHWEQVRPEVEVKLVGTPNGEETYILCRSTARKEKETAIRSRFSGRMEKALGSLQKRVSAGKLKDRHKIERHLGKIQARHPQVADLYQVQVRETAEGLLLHWKLIADRQAWQQMREGAYLLRTNLKAERAEDLWQKYVQLTEAEAAFRALKSELSIRPIFHQLEHRVKAHVLVAFLGYALWVTLKHLLRRKNSHWTPAQALSILSTLQCADIILPTTDGRAIRLRRITTPTAEQKQLLALLDLNLPEHLNFNQECSGDSKTA
jgi:transposase